MLTAGPGQTITLSQDGLPSSASVGYQVVKAATGTVAIGRTTTGVIERPAGTGNYVVTFVAPAEPDLYLIVLDWAGGALSPTTSKVDELAITSATSVDTGLGAIADYARVYLGAETFDAIVSDPEQGEGVVAKAVGAVKSRVFTTPPDTDSEVMLPQLVLSYLGKLTALELMPAARSFWNTKEQSKVVGNRPAEVITFPSRQAYLDELSKSLLDSADRDWPLVLPMIDTPLLQTTANGPMIDEDEDCHVTRDPRDFPHEETFPYQHAVGSSWRRW